MVVDIRGCGYDSLYQIFANFFIFLTRYLGSRVIGSNNNSDPTKRKLNSAILNSNWCYVLIETNINTNKTNLITSATVTWITFNSN